jgi:hypothetical protein
MATNVELDPKLMREALRVGKHKTKREAIEAALREYVNKNKQPSIIEMFGKVDYWPDYDYKANRRKR